MTVTITFNLPSDLERKLRTQTDDLADDVKQAYVVELFRQGRLTHYELSQALGLDRHQTDAYLKRRHIFEGSLSMKDLDEDRQTLEQLFGKDR